MDCVKHPAGPGLILWTGLVEMRCQAMVGGAKLIVGKGDLIFLLWGILFDGFGRAAESVAAAAHRDDFGVMEKATETGEGGWGVVEQFAPFFDGPVGCHHDRSVLLAAEDDFEEEFGAFEGQSFEAPVIDDEDVWFEITGHAAIQFGRGDLLIGVCF